MIRDADKLCETGFLGPSCSRPSAVALSDIAFEQFNAKRQAAKNAETMMELPALF